MHGKHTGEHRRGLRKQVVASFFPLGFQCKMGAPKLFHRRRLPSLLPVATVFLAPVDAPACPERRRQSLFSFRDENQGNSRATSEIERVSAGGSAESRRATRKSAITLSTPLSLCLNAKTHLEASRHGSRALALAEKDRNRQPGRERRRSSCRKSRRKSKFFLSPTSRERKEKKERSERRDHGASIFFTSAPRFFFFSTLFPPFLISLSL